MSRIRLTIAALAAVAAVATAVPTVVATATPDITTAVQFRPAPEWQPYHHCSDRLIKNAAGTRRGGIASCSNLPSSARWYVVVVCYGSSKLQGFPSYFGSPTQSGNAWNVTVWCSWAKPYGYNVYVVVIR